MEFRTPFRGRRRTLKHSVLKRRRRQCTFWGTLLPTVPALRPVFFASLARFPLASPRSFPRGVARWALLGAVLACAWPAPVHAQQESRARPFSTLSLYAGGSATVGTGALGPYYRSFPGFDVNITTPFYAGRAGLSAGLLRFEARAGRAQEDLWAAPVALRWGLHPSLLGTGRLHTHASLRLGTLFMRFSGGSAGLRNESELLMGADAGLSVRLAGRWRLAAGMRYDRVFTSTPFPLWQVHAGVQRRFDAPRWIQTLLR